MSDRVDDLDKAYTKALAHEKAGEIDKAAQGYQDCLRLDPADHGGASVRLAAMGRGQIPQKAPDAYVETLFDQHADQFDDILTGHLGYAVPMQLANLFQAAPPAGGLMLDLGCGTGLSGMTLGPWYDSIIGVDISENMIDLADERAVYDRLYVNEAVHFLEEWTKARNGTGSENGAKAETQNGKDFPCFDLIVATDVLPYIGDLEPLFEGIANNLAPEGGIAISSETLSEPAFENKDWLVTRGHRFAHSKAYLTELLGKYGFTRIDNFDAITVRTEEGIPVPGWLVVAWKR